MQRIYQRYFTPQHTTRIYGIAMNAGNIAENLRKDQHWFDKPVSSVIFNGEPIKLLKHMDGVAHEVELGVVIGMAGKDI